MRWHLLLNRSQSLRQIDIDLNHNLCGRAPIILQLFADAALRIDWNSNVMIKDQSESKQTYWLSELTVEMLELLKVYVSKVRVVLLSTVLKSQTLHPCKSKTLCTNYRKRFVSHLYFWELIHACMFVTRCGWGMVVQGSSPIPAANVQYACNNRNFANRIEMGLCPLLSRQPKPQSHTKSNKRKWGKGGVRKPRKDVLVRRKRSLRQTKRE